MPTLRHLPAAFVLGLLVVPAASHGKPSSQAPATTKQSPPVSAGAVKKVKKIANKHIGAVKKAKPMTLAAKREVIAAAGLSPGAADIGEPVTVSVRDPRENNVTLAFTGLNMVLANQGIAVIGQLNDMNEFDGPSSATTEEAVAADGCSVGPFMALCEIRRVASAAGAPATSGVFGGYVTLRFRAAPETAYIVDCLASSDAEVRSLVIVDKAVVDDDASTADGSFDFYVGRGPRRDVRIDLVADQPWTFRQCQLTPVR